jgi:preprotein translocase subunit YajC
MIYSSLVYLAQAATPSQPPPAQPIGGMLIPFICIIVIFYFLIIRPQHKKQKQHQTLIQSLKSGDKVVTNGGIHGLISNVKDSTVMLKVADNVKIEVEKSSVVAVSKREEAA